MTSPRTGRARPLPPDARRLLIVSAAEPLVREHGYSVTTRQLAQAAGVAEGTLFRVFPDKDAIVAAALSQAFSPAEVVEELEAIDVRMPLDDKLEAVATVLQRRVRSILEVVTALQSRPRRGPDGLPGGRGHGPPGRDPGGGEVGEAIAALLAPDADRLALPPLEVATLLRGLVLSTTWPGPARSALSLSALVSVLLDGVRAPCPAPPRRS